MIEAYPLAWPEGRQRTPLAYREPAKFECTMARARDDVLHEIGMMGGKDPIISTRRINANNAGATATFWRALIGENRRTTMDHFGIGAAIRGAANIYFRSARRSGRTSSLVESVKDGDRIVFVDGREAERVRRLCLKRGVKVECVVVDPKTPERVFERGTAQGRTIFDHSWVEKWYVQAIDCAATDFDNLERQASGYGGVHRETRRVCAEEEEAKWHI